VRRRDFLKWIAGSVAAWPLAARAQPQMRRIAWLGLGRADAPSPYVDALRAGLRDWGWIEGRNLTLALYWATGREDMEAAARELLASDPEVIVTQELMVYAMRSLKPATPVVFGFSGDPVHAGLVESFARPGGNFTGMTYLALELVGKRIELLKELVPQTRRVAILARPQHPGEPRERQASEAVVGKLGIELSYFPYGSASWLPAREFGELDNMFRAISDSRCDALVVFPDSAMFEISDRIARFAVETRLPRSRAGLRSPGTDCCSLMDRTSASYIAVSRAMQTAFCAALNRPTFQLKRRPRSSSSSTLKRPRRSDSRCRRR
jgi:putative tryptophan/tyrosine transport system substrate-binding protein